MLCYLIKVNGTTHIRVLDQFIIRRLNTEPYRYINGLMQNKFMVEFESKTLLTENLSIKEQQ